VILSRKRVDSDWPKSACQSAHFQMTDGLGRFQPRELHQHLLSGLLLDRSTLRQEFEQLHQARSWRGLARFGSTTPTRAGRLADASVESTEARKLSRPASTPSRLTHASPDRRCGRHDERARSLSLSREHELFARSSDGIIRASDQTTRDTRTFINSGWPRPVATKGGRATDSVRLAGDSSHAES
jgi:hypothetical protein